MLRSIFQRFDISTRNTVLGRSLVGKAYRHLRRNGLLQSLSYLRTWLGNLILRKAVAVGIGEQAAPYLISERSQQPATATRFFDTPYVVVIGALDLEQCKKFRVLQKIEALDAMRIRSGYSHWKDKPRAFDLLQLATTVIFYRTPADDGFWELVQEAVRLGVRVGYDIDDPIFDAGVYGSNRNLDFLHKRERMDLIFQSKTYWRAMRACDFLITSTPGMHEILERHISAPIFVWRNAIDAETLQASASIAQNPSTSTASGSSGITLVYASGSRAHEADFRVVAPALTKAMVKHPDVRLKIIGHLDIPAEFGAFLDRIEVVKLKRYPEYLAELATADICLIPLLIDEFNACKSAIRFLDASSVNVPSIVSAVGDFENLIIDGETALLARNDEDWTSHLDRMINSEFDRKRMASMAHSYVMSKHTVFQTEASLAPALKIILRND